MQFTMANSARHSCFYFLSVAMKREKSKKVRERKQNETEENSRTPDREN